MPSDFMLKTMNGIHRTVFRASGGRLLGKVGGMLVVDLHTTGRKSGAPRSSMLTSPVQNGDEFVLVASRGGDPQHPLVPQPQGEPGRRDHGRWEAQTDAGARRDA